MATGGGPDDAALDLSQYGAPMPSNGPDLSGSGKLVDLSSMGKPVDEAASPAVGIPSTAAPSSADEPKPVDTGFIGAAREGIVSSIRDFAQTGAALSRQRGPEHQPTTLAEQPMQWGDLLRPGTFAEKALYGLAKSWPQVAGGVAGASIGTGLGGGPEEPVGWAGGVAGGFLGAGAVGAAQSLGSYFMAEQQKTPDDPDGAFDRALQQASIEGAASGVSWTAFSWSPFKGAVKNLLFQAFGVQPAITLAGHAAQNVVDGQPATEGLAEDYPGAVAGTLVPAAGHTREHCPRAVIHRRTGRLIRGELVAAHCSYFFASLSWATASNRTLSLRPTYRSSARPELGEQLSERRHSRFVGQSECHEVQKDRGPAHDTLVVDLLAVEVLSNNLSLDPTPEVSDLSMVPADAIDGVSLVTIVLIMENPLGFMGDGVPIVEQGENIGRIITADRSHLDVPFDHSFEFVLGLGLSQGQNLLLIRRRRVHLRFTVDELPAISKERSRIFEHVVAEKLKRQQEEPNMSKPIAKPVGVEIFRRGL
jgi:hypothetical protein